MPTKTPTTTEEPKAARAKKSESTRKKDVASPSASSANGAPSETVSKDNSLNGNSYLSPTDMEHFQDLLLVERARLEEEREQIRSRSGSVDGALPEEGEGGDEDTADLASAMMDKEMDLSVEDEIEDLLGQVAHALRKIDDGTYGICDMSGEKIAKARLELIPWAALTVECQAIAEGQ